MGVSAKGWLYDSHRGTERCKSRIEQDHRRKACHPEDVPDNLLWKKSEGTSTPKTSGKDEVKFSPITTYQDEVAPVEKRIRDKKPTCDGLYPHEVLVLSYAPRYCDNGNEYPRFWWNSYGIKDIPSILRSLQQKGLITVGDISDAINMEKLPVIKEELKKRDLKVTGKKADLISRLIENADETELASVFTRRPFSLTTDGETIVKKYEWIPDGVFVHIC